MRPELGVKQYVAVMRGRHGRFMVFETGDARFYLFSQVAPDGTLTGLSWPVRKADLQPTVRSALRNGWGNTGLSQESSRP